MRYMLANVRDFSAPKRLYNDTQFRATYAHQRGIHTFPNILTMLTVTISKFFSTSAGFNSCKNLTKEKATAARNSLFPPDIKLITKSGSQSDIFIYSNCFISALTFICDEHNMVFSKMETYGNRFKYAVY